MPWKKGRRRRCCVSCPSVCRKFLFLWSAPALSCPAPGQFVRSYDLGRKPSFSLWSACCRKVGGEMDRLLSKIRDLSKEAENLAKQQQQLQQRQQQQQQQQYYQHQQQYQHQGAGKVSSPGEAQSFSQWIQELRIKAGGWTAGPLVVLSLFDGIGGIWTALSLLGVPFSGYSCEVNESAVQVVKARYPMVQHVGDVSTLQLHAIPEKVDLVVGGFPCQDLSSMGHRMGLHGQRSKLFFEMLRIINVFKPTWFLAENVASMAWQDRDEISKHLRTIPIEVDSQELTPSKRKRLYWSNIPYPKKIPHLRDHGSTSLQSVLKDGTALDSKIGCIMSTNNQRGGNVSLELVMDNATCALRYISVMEVEKALGYPAGYTNVRFGACEHKESPVTVKYERIMEDVTRVTRKTSRNKQIVRTSPIMQRVQTIHPQADGVNKNIRWGLLGNTFSVNVIAYLLSPLLERSGRASLRPINLPKSIREQDCSAMDPGEIWALYNSHERPNWYALIVSRTGDRFTCVPGRKKKSPVHIEVRFMEMTEPYAAEEVDEWDAIRGTGLYKVRKVVDNQNSWVTFSHRIDNYIKFDEHYFIFPAKEEVWAVYDRTACSRYLVFVTESHLDQNKAKQGKPGKESFHARCCLLQRVDNELYRLLEKAIDYTDLSLFAFKAPYVYKNEGTILKIDLTTRQKARRSDIGHYKVKRRDSDSDSDADEEIPEEDAGFAELMGVDGIATTEICTDSNSSPGNGIKRLRYK